MSESNRNKHRALFSYLFIRRYVPSFHSLQMVFKIIFSTCKIICAFIKIPGAQCSLCNRSLSQTVPHRSSLLRSSKRAYDSVTFYVDPFSKSLSNPFRKTTIFQWTCVHEGKPAITPIKDSLGPHSTSSLSIPKLAGTSHSMLQLRPGTINPWFSFMVYLW